MMNVEHYSADLKDDTEFRGIIQEADNEAI